MKPVPEQRRARRYRVGMDVRFQWSHADHITTGMGRATDFSDISVRLDTDEYVPKGTEVEVRMPWPVHLQSSYPLELVIRGAVIRSGDGFSVLQIGRYEFRTCGPYSFDQATLSGGSCNIVG